MTSQRARFQNRLFLVKRVEPAKDGLQSFLDSSLPVWRHLSLKMMVKRTFETTKVQMCGFDWAVTCVTLSRTQWEIAPLTAGPRVRLSSVTSGSGGRENRREQRAGLLWRDRITEWLAIHDCESAGARRRCGVKTCLCYSSQVSDRWRCAVTVLIIYFGRDREKRKNASAPAPARYAYLLLYNTKHHLTVCIMQLSPFCSQAEL